MSFNSKTESNSVKNFALAFIPKVLSFFNEKFSSNLPIYKVLESISITLFSTHLIVLALYFFIIE